MSTCCMRLFTSERCSLWGNICTCGKDAIRFDFHYFLFEKEVKNFEAKVEELKTNIDRKQNSLKKGSIEAMSKVQDKLKMIINDLAKEKSLDLIIPASQTLFAKDEFDITAEVLVILNKKISKVDVKFE